MNKLLKVLIAGTVINFIAVPFFYSQTPGSRFDINLSFKNTAKFNSENYIYSLKYYNLAADTGKQITADSNFTKDSVFTTKKITDKKFKMKKSPWIAVLLSALMPGAGQYYNRSYWKVPVILGFAGYFAYEFWREDKNYRDYRDQYAASQTPLNPEGDDNLKSLREFYRNQRGDFTWYFMIVYFINLVDAYIDAHLFDFDVRDEKMVSGAWDKKATLKVHINF